LFSEEFRVSQSPRPSRRIFELLRAYHESRENIRALVDMSRMSDYEKVGFIDAWQEEMADFFADNGYCFACNRQLERCGCEEPLRPLAASRPA
jgi:uncharacterized protein YjiS (DUF1127 family)